MTHAIEPLSISFLFFFTASRNVNQINLFRPINKINVRTCTPRAGQRRKKMARSVMCVCWVFFYRCCFFFSIWDLSILEFVQQQKKRAVNCVFSNLSRKYNEKKNDEKRSAGDLHCMRLSIQNKLTGFF